MSLIVFSSFIQTASSSLHPSKSSSLPSLPFSNTKQKYTRKISEDWYRTNTSSNTTAIPSRIAKISINGNDDDHNLEDCNHSDDKDIINSSSPQVQVAKTVQSFRDDIKYFESLPKTELTKPYVSLCHDAATYTKIWTLQDWKGK